MKRQFLGIFLILILLFAGCGRGNAPVHAGAYTFKEACYGDVTMTADEYRELTGIDEVSLELKSDRTFSCRITGAPSSGNWEENEEGNLTLSSGGVRLTAEPGEDGSLTVLASDICLVFVPDNH